MTVQRREVPPSCGKLRLHIGHTVSGIPMSSTLEVLEAEVLKLSPSERSRLLERLIVSLDEDVEIEKAWTVEADRREAELDSGSVTAISGDQMMERLRARLE